MSKLFSFFNSKEGSLPEFSERADALRPTLSSMSSEQLLKVLIEVSKVWTYDYEERKPFMQELFDRLPQKMQVSLIACLTDCLPGREVSRDIPLALSQVKKEKLVEMTSSFAL